MEPHPFLGVGLHALGGAAAGSFYIPYKRVRGWAWESYWLTGGVFSWILAPWAMAFAVVDDPVGLLAAAPRASLAWSYFFGVLWGVGGLTFGLSMRYLGMSLGYALALGFCAAFGTLVPPVFEGELGALLGTGAGLTVVAGVATCLAGIAVCGLAGVRKEREPGAGAKAAAIAEFDFARGVWVAVFAGIMSACMAFAIAAGKPIAELAVARGTAPLWQNAPVFIVVLAGGFTTNALWCGYLNWRNGTGGDYLRADAPRLANVFFSALAGVTWYFQFHFYGMGATQMGALDFSSWTLHMAFIIVVSNVWAFALREWRGAGAATLRIMAAGLALLLASTVIVGWGNALAQ